MLNFGGVSCNALVTSDTGLMYFFSKRGAKDPRNFQNRKVLVLQAAVAQRIARLETRVSSLEEELLEAECSIYDIYGGNTFRETSATYSFKSTKKKRTWRKALRFRKNARSEKDNSF